MQSKKYSSGCFEHKIQKSKFPKWECPSIYNAVKKQLIYAEMASKIKTMDKTPFFRQNQ